MFNLIFSGLFIFSLCLISGGAHADSLSEAQSKYAQRSFDEAGRQVVSEAISLYKESLAGAGDSLDKNMAYNGIAQGYYFLGTIPGAEKQKKADFLKSMEAALEVSKSFSIDKAHKLTPEEIQALSGRLSEKEQELLAKSMYFFGISLAQWGNLEGFGTSLSRLGEVKGNMKNIEAMGFVAIFDYGPKRTLGRIDFVIPAFLGGNKRRSQKTLLEVFKNTRAVDSEGKKLKYSLNGYTNVYLAEVFEATDQKNKAIALLENFVAAEPASLDPNMIPENTRAKEEALDFLKKWKK